jgi:hypothetical protein
VQMPPKEVKVFAPDFKKGLSKEILANDSITKKAIAYYQCASWLIRNGKYNAIR